MVMGLVKFVPAMCVQCGAQLQVPEDLEKIFCNYCGTSFILDKGQQMVPCPSCKGTGAIKCEGQSRIMEFPHNYGKDDMHVELKIFSCDGTGKCSVMASGVAYMLGMPVGDIQIPQDPNHGWCKSGSCYQCNGTGHRESTDFWGKPKLEVCPVCKGKAKCPVCHGTGKCSFCNGVGEKKCTKCKGTGIWLPPKNGSKKMQ